MFFSAPTGQFDPSKMLQPMIYVHLWHTNHTPFYSLLCLLQRPFNLFLFVRRLFFCFFVSPGRDKSPGGSLSVLVKLLCSLLQSWRISPPECSRSSGSPRGGRRANITELNYQCWVKSPTMNRPEWNRSLPALLKAIICRAFTQSQMRELTVIWRQGLCNILCSCGLWERTRNY